jgi:hypothetical protein
MVTPAVESVSNIGTRVPVSSKASMTSLSVMRSREESSSEESLIGGLEVSSNFLLMACICTKNDNFSFASYARVQVNQRNHFLPNVCGILLPLEPAGGEQKSADVEWKTVTLIYPYPSCSSKMFFFW